MTDMEERELKVEDILVEYHRQFFVIVQFHPIISFVDAKLRKKLVKAKRFWKINAVRPKIKARRGRMKKFNLGQKAKWGGLVKELDCQIVTQKTGLLGGLIFLY